MSVYSQDFYRGILLRDPRFSAATISTADTTATQASPTVDEPIAAEGKQGTMDLQATGSSGPGLGYDIRTIKPGGAWGEDRGGRFSWRPTSQSADATKWRGWDPYALITGTESVRHIAGAGKDEIACWPDAITTESERVHIVYNHVGSSIVDHLYCRTLDPITGMWSEVSIASSALGENTYGPAAIVELPGGRLLVIQQRASDPTVVETYISDDNGATWAAGSHKRKSAGIEDTEFTFVAGSSFIKVRAVYHNGYITMIREATDNGAPTPKREVDHYVSEDLGASWTLVERFQPDASPLTGLGTSAARVHDPELQVSANGSVMLILSRAWDVDNKGASYWADPSYLKKGGPFGKFAEDPSFGTDTTPGTKLGLAPGLTGGTIVYNTGYHVTCVDPAGALVHVTQGPLNYNPSTTAGTDFRSALAISRMDLNSPENGLSDLRSHTWGPFCMSDNAIAGGAMPDRWPLLDITGVNGGSAPDYVTQVSRSCVVAYKDRLLLVSGQPYDISSGQSDADDVSLRLIELGRSSNYDHEMGHVWEVNDATPVRSGFTYLPFEAPPMLVSGVAGLTAFDVVGSMAFGFSGLGLRMVSTSDSYGIRYAGTAIWARVKSDTAATVPGADITAGYVSVRARGVEVRIGSGKAQVWDLTGSPVSLTNVITLPAGMRDWYVTTKTIGANHYAWVMYKDPGASDWITVTWKTAGQLAGSPTGDTEWGQPALSSITSHWQMVQSFATTTADSENWTDANYHPGMQNGRPFSLYPTYVDGGWQVASRGGPAFRSDEWQMTTRYEFPIDAIHPEIAGTPRVGWRSVNDDAEQIITWAPSGTTDTRQLSPVIGVHLSGINFRTAYLEGWNGSSWVAISTIDAGADLNGLRFDRSGDTIYPTTTGAQYSADRYLQLDELTGSYAVFDPGGGSMATRKIAHNSEGGWANPATPKSAELHIDGDASTLPASGDFEIWESAVTAIGYGSVAAYDKYRLRIPVQVTAEGYFKIGACIIGPVLYFGTDYSWGRSVSLTPNNEITTGRSGDRIVEELGPPRRLVEFAWAEGWDITKISGTSPGSYDHITADSAHPVGVRQDATILEGMLRRSRGAAEPVVYLPRIVPDDSGSPGQDRQILGRDRHMYGRIVSQVTRQAILGDEGVNEVQTINAISIEEEI